jgi:hypothetical protein
MSIISIPFRDDMQERSLSGRKTATSRNIKYGDVGDIFKIRTGEFEIVKVSRLKLKVVAETKYYEEGFNTPEEFISIWKQIHYKLGWTPEKLIWFHEYRRMNND